MEIGSDLLTWGVSGLISVGIAFGMMKGALSNKVDYNTHRDICATQKRETLDEIRELRNDQKTMLTMLSVIQGYLRKENGGQL